MMESIIIDDIEYVQPKDILKSNKCNINAMIKNGTMLKSDYVYAHKSNNDSNVWEYSYNKVKNSILYIRKDWLCTNLFMYVPIKTESEKQIADDNFIYVYVLNIIKHDNNYICKIGTIFDIKDVQHIMKDLNVKDFDHLNLKNVNYCMCMGDFVKIKLNDLPKVNKYIDRKLHKKIVNVDYKSFYDLDQKELSNVTSFIKKKYIF